MGCIPSPAAYGYNKPLDRSKLPVVDPPTHEPGRGSGDGGKGQDAGRTGDGGEAQDSGGKGQDAGRRGDGGKGQDTGGAGRKGDGGKGQGTGGAGRKGDGGKPWPWERRAPRNVRADAEHERRSFPPLPVEGSDSEKVT